MHDRGCLDPPTAMGEVAAYQPSSASVFIRKKRQLHSYRSILLVLEILRRIFCRYKGEWRSMRRKLLIFYLSRISSNALLEELESALGV